MIQPGEKLILTLNKLRERLSSSGVERTAGLRKAMGNDCSFYRKSLDIFLNRDYDELENLVIELAEQFSHLKGPSE